MASDATLPGTAIEWYMFGAALVGINVVVLLATGHTLFQSVAMGLFYGLTIALVAVLLVAVWTAIRGGSGDGPERVE